MHQHSDLLHAPWRPLLFLSFPLPSHTRAMGIRHPASGISAVPSCQESCNTVFLQLALCTRRPRSQGRHPARRRTGITRKPTQRRGSLPRQVLSRSGLCRKQSGSGQKKKRRTPAATATREKNKRCRRQRNRRRTPAVTATRKENRRFVNKPSANHLFRVVVLHETPSFVFILFFACAVCLAVSFF